jgi:hypothetical protein
MEAQADRRDRRSTLGCGRSPHRGSAREHLTQRDERIVDRFARQLAGLVVFG